MGLVGAGWGSPAGAGAGRRRLGLVGAGWDQYLSPNCPYGTFVTNIPVAEGQR